MSKKKIVALIPARGGSKGLKDKNITNLAGKPLIAWSIQAALASHFIAKTFVSSDSDTILNIAQTHGADTIKRPHNLALDDTPSEAVIFHALELLKKKGEDYDYLILLQPTSPLRKSKDIDAAFTQLFSQNCDSLIGVYKEEKKILKAFIENSDGYIQGLVNNTFPFMPRQKLPAVYMSNGAIYIIKISEFLKSATLLTNKTTAFEMPKELSLDIDTQADLDMAEKILMRKSSNE